MKRIWIGLAGAVTAAAVAAALLVGHWTRQYEAALRASDFDAADAALDRLAWLGLDGTDRRLLLANGYASAKDFAGAEQQLLRSLEISPDPRVWDGLGLLRSNFGDWEGVIEAHEGSRAAGGGEHLLRHATRARVALGDRDAAFEVLDTASREHPDSRQVQVQAAVMATELGDPVRIVRFYEEALRIEPELAYVANNLAWYYATEEAVRDPERALQLAQRAVQGEESSNPNHLETLARAQAEMGRIDEAVRTARRAAELAGESGDAALRERLLEWLASQEPDAADSAPTS